MIQLETIQKEKSLEKERLIAPTKQVKKSEVSHNVWLLSSGNPKTSKRFHYVKREEGLGCLFFGYKVFEISKLTLCKHIYSHAIWERANTR